MAKENVEESKVSSDDGPPPPTEEYPNLEPLGVAESEDSYVSPKQVERPKVVLKPSTSDRPKETPSIFGRKKAKDSEVKEAVPIAEKRKKAYTEEDLQEAWKAFAESMPDAGDTDRLILGKAVKKSSDDAVIIMLGSQLEVSFLEKFDTELVQFLRETLENDHVVIRKEIAEMEEEKKLYTSTDIFDYMVKQNPDLKDLKDRLGLDFDY